MLFDEALEMMVKFAENYAHAIPKMEEAVAVVRKFMEGGTLLVIILHPSGNIEIQGATCQDIKIDDRRGG